MQASYAQSSKLTVVCLLKPYYEAVNEAFELRGINMDFIGDYRASPTLELAAATSLAL